MVSPINSAATARIFNPDESDNNRQKIQRPKTASSRSEQTLSKETKKLHAKVRVLEAALEKTKSSATAAMQRNTEYSTKNRDLQARIKVLEAQDREHRAVTTAISQENAKLKRVIESLKNQAAGSSPSPKKASENHDTTPTSQPKTLRKKDPSTTPNTDSSHPSPPKGKPFQPMSVQARGQLPNWRGWQRF